jgi:3-dehydroquinate synthase
VADLELRFRTRPAASRVHIRRAALGRLGMLVRRAATARRAALITDATVGRLHGGAALRALRRAGIAADRIVAPAGERAKTPARLTALWDALARLEIGRDDMVVALGGGSVGDLAGFAAATWLRGVAWVCVPTSLLAQVDSSIGGKTAVDLAAGKNLVGAFHQPALVVIDPDLLATLPARERRQGLAEVVKTGMAADARLFAYAERRAAALAGGDIEALAGAVERSVRAKARVVLADEREREGGGRSALNYGHTLGHALEAVHGYRGLRHGDAVAIGMRAASLLSVRLAGLSPGARARQEALLDGFGLPRSIENVALRALLSAMRHDKKRRSSQVRWVLTPRIGHASVPRPIERRALEAALIEVGARR